MFILLFLRGKLRITWSVDILHQIDPTDEAFVLQNKHATGCLLYNADDNDSNSYIFEHIVSI